MFFVFSAHARAAGGDGEAIVKVLKFLNVPPATLASNPILSGVTNHHDGLPMEGESSAFDDGQNCLVTLSNMALGASGLSVTIDVPAAAFGVTYSVVASRDEVVHVDADEDFGLLQLDAIQPTTPNHAHEDLYVRKYQDSSYYEDGSFDFNMIRIGSDSDEASATEVSCHIPAASMPR